MQKNNGGWIALMYACRYGHKEVVKLLLNYHNSGIEFNARDKNGKTALMLASIYGYKDVVELIKSKLNL